MTNKLIRLPEVESRCGLKKSAIYARVKRGQFPAPIKLGGGPSIAFVSDEVDAWIESQIRASRTPG